MSVEALDAQWGECWLEPGPVPADLEKTIKKFTGGAMPEWGARLAQVPWVARGFLHGMDKRIAYMPLRLWDLISFVVSQDNACRYCYGATRTVLKILGFGEESIDRLERETHLAELTAAEEAALQFARKMTQANPSPSAADLRALEAAGFTRQAIAEIVFCSAFNGYGNRVATLFALPPDQFERIVERWFVRLLRPLVARQFRGKHRAPAPLPAPNEPPFAELIATLQGSPGAHAVRSMVDDAIASPVLPRRTKLLIFAVIARALGCEYVKRQAERGLAAAGLAAADVEEILANLASTKLDARERLLVPFARETVRYRNRAIQERTHELSRHMRTEELIEAVGVAALANAVVRASVLLDQC